MAVLSLEAQAGRRPWPLWLICLPLLLPQASLLFGIRLGVDWFSLGWGQRYRLGLGALEPAAVCLSLCLFVPARPLSPVRRAAHPERLAAGGNPVASLVAGERAAAGPSAVVCLRRRSSCESGPIPADPAVWRLRVVTITTEAVAIGSGLNRRLAGSTACCNCCCHSLSICWRSGCRPDSTRRSREAAHDELSCWK